MKNKYMKNTTIPVKFDSIEKKYYKYIQCKECINDYDDPQMCKFCKNGDRQTLSQ